MARLLYITTITNYLMINDQPFFHPPITIYVIDDVLIFWNNNRSGLKFSHEIHKGQNNFLDLTIFFKINKHIQTDIFKNPTSINCFLHWNSWPPGFLSRSIPTGQYLRARHNYSEERDFQNECLNLLLRFQHEVIQKKRS